MSTETERKFLVTSDAWRPLAHPPEGERLCQGYLCSASGRTVRVRLAGERAFLTIKGPSGPGGLSRDEFEYPIPPADARHMLGTLCVRPLIDKTRHHVDAGGGLVWEIDVFHSDNAPLVVAEIELPREDTPFTRPAWLGREVTADERYRNSVLASRPYSTWAAAQRG